MPMRRTAPLEHLQPTLERGYTVMGETLLFQTNHPRLLETADESFGRYPACPPNARQPAHDGQPLIVRLFVTEPRQPEPDTAHPLPVYHTQEHLFHIQVGEDNWAVVDLQGGFAFGLVTTGMAHDRPFVRVTFVEAMCLAMLSLGRNFSNLHAACVVKNGVSVTLQGRNNTGKSTLAYACARRGYQVLTEDVVHIKVRPESVALWGSPWKLHLLVDAQRLFPELSGLSPALQINGEWKLEVDLESLYPQSTVVQARPGLMVLLVRGSGGLTRVEPISREQALSHSEIIWPWQTGWTAELERGSQSLLDGGTLRLHINGTPDQAVDALDSLIEEARTKP